MQVAAVALAQESATEADVVRCEGDRLTLDVASMPLRTLLLEVGRQSGAQVRIEGLDDRTVSEAFTRVRLDEALRRVLGDSNFTLVYAAASQSDGKPSSLRLKELRVYGGEGTVVSSNAARPKPARPDAPAARPTAAGPATALPPRAAPTGVDQRRAGTDAGVAQEQVQPQAAMPGPNGVQGQTPEAAAEVPPGQAQPAVVDIGQAAVDAAAEENPAAVAPPPALTNPVSAAVLGGGGLAGEEGAWQPDVDPDAVHQEYEAMQGPVEEGGVGIDAPE